MNLCVAWWNDEALLWNMEAVSVVKIELHRKFEGEKPCCEGVKLEQILLDNLVNLLVSGGRVEW